MGSYKEYANPLGCQLWSVSLLHSIIDMKLACPSLDTGYEFPIPSSKFLIPCSNFRRIFVTGQVFIWFRSHKKFQRSSLQNIGMTDIKLWVGFTV